MNILMMTNTYLPFIGGVIRSVQLFSEEYRRMGHRVVIVAPEFENMPENEQDVIRVPALQHFNGTGFSVQLPVPGVLLHAFQQFKPDIVHSHHPFMIGDSALHVAAQFNVPIIFTFHTFYEQYTHYVPGDSPALKRFVVTLATGYANLCDQVFAPSQSVADELRRRGVITLIDIVPTGIEIEKFASGDGIKFRDVYGIPRDAFVLGVVSRLAPEKNLDFLGLAVKQYLQNNSKAVFLVIGSGPSEQKLKKLFETEKMQGRFFYPGALLSQTLIDAYHAIDIFVFTSKTETQGLVVTEAMAAGVPVVAIDGPGIGEVIIDRKNGRLLKNENVEEYCEALQWVFDMGNHKRQMLKLAAMETAAFFSQHVCAMRAVEIYNALLEKTCQQKDRYNCAWAKAKRFMRVELELLKNRTRATGAALKNGVNGT